MMSQRLDVDGNLTPRIALPLANYYLDWFTCIKFCGIHLCSLQECGDLRHSCGSDTRQTTLKLPGVRNTRMPHRLCHVALKLRFDLTNQCTSHETLPMLRGHDVLYVVFGILEATMTTPKPILLLEVRTRTGHYCCNSFIRELPFHHQNKLVSK
jgi:hypothetical protein